MAFSVYVASYDLRESDVMEAAKLPDGLDPRTHLSESWSGTINRASLHDRSRVLTPKLAIPLTVRSGRTWHTHRSPLGDLPYLPLAHP